MIKHIIYIIFIFISSVVFAQNEELILEPAKKTTLEGESVTNRLGDTKLDSLSQRDEFKVELSEKTKFTDYKIISFKKDTIYVDTTLTIKKDYKFNYLRKDNFELLEFHNQGQTFSNLAYTFSAVSLYPKIGARAKHHNFYEIEDINYYKVATPISELMYKAGLEQGQLLNTLIALNITERHNMSFAYKGLRSLGKYRNNLSSHGNMTLTYSYSSKKDRYRMRSHIVAQELLNNENGGLIEKSINDFESNDPDFRDRGRLETYFTNASNTLRGNRYYLDHEYDLMQKKDSLSQKKFALAVGHTFSYETKHYQFNQSAKNNYFGEAYRSNILDYNSLAQFYNQVSVSLLSPIILGNLKFYVDNYDYDYRYKNIVVLDNNQFVSQSLHSNVSSVGAEWKTKLKGFAINAKAATTFSGDLNGNFVKVAASYKRDSLLTFKVTFLNNSKAPNFNFLLNQSAYKAYNWQNDNFKNELTRTLLFELNSDRLINASAQITQLDNYSYFGDTIANTQPKPLQYSGTINYLKVKASRAISYKKFTLENTVMYQKIANGDEVFRVPTFVTRNTIYYANDIFKKKPMYLQAGVTFRYFTKYYANSYNPLLSEFSLQNEVEIGNYPVLDVFINARVRNMRIFLKADHLNSIFSPKKYYSAPNHPYRDYVLRLGLVWNFFI